MRGKAQGTLRGGHLLLLASTEMVLKYLTGIPWVVGFKIGPSISLLYLLTHPPGPNNQASCKCYLALKSR